MSFNVSERQNDSQVLRSPKSRWSERICCSKCAKQIKCCSSGQTHEKQQIAMRKLSGCLLKREETNVSTNPKISFGHIWLSLWLLLRNKTKHVCLPTAWKVNNIPKTFQSSKKTSKQELQSTMINKTSPKKVKELLLKGSTPPFGEEGNTSGWLPSTVQPASCRCIYALVHFQLQRPRAQRHTRTHCKD